MAERIVGKRFGKEIYYYYHNCYRVKINPEDKGKTRNTGKSKVVTEAIYLGKARDVAEKVKMVKEVSTCQSVKEIEFGLPLALYNMAQEINLVGIIDKHVKKRAQGLSVGEYILISAINRVGNRTSKEQMSGWLPKTHLRGLFKKDTLRLKSQNFYDNEELDKVINDEVIEKIENDIWYELQRKFNLYLDVILYDTTPFLTHIDKFTNCSIPLLMF